MEISYRDKKQPESGSILFDATIPKHPPPTIVQTPSESLDKSEARSEELAVEGAFRLFPRLPVEIRLKVWTFASDKNRIVDLWTEFRRCEVDNSVFYQQFYESKFTDTYSRVLDINRESREESLKCLPLEFGTKTLKHGAEVGHDANIRVHWVSDIILPRGFWNMIAFEDVLRRTWCTMSRLAIDPTTSFWTDELKKYVLEGVWPFLEVEEITLYDASNLQIVDFNIKILKPHSIARPIKQPLQFEFVEDEPSGARSLVANSQTTLNLCFDKLEAKKGESIDHASELERLASKDLVYDPAFSEEFKRPKIRVMKLQVAKQQKV